MWSLTRERKEPRIVAASTPSRVFRIALLRPGRAILEALIAGETDPDRLADLAARRVKAPRPLLAEALNGRVTAHHRFMLRLHLTQITALEGAITDVEANIREALALSVANIPTAPRITDGRVFHLQGEGTCGPTRC